ncbi:MAG: VTT domain-containing protein [Pseudomonadota bacterium]
MLSLVRRLSRFLTSMDGKTATSLVVSAILIIFVGVMLLYGQDWLSLDADDTGGGALTGLFMRASESPLAIIAVIAIFAFLALTGFPQILLITATVMWFGPRVGAGYSWVATMASATLTFAIGHMLGGAWVLKAGGDRATRLIDFLQRRGAVASGLIRVVPSAPFIVVNAAAGAAHIPLWKYWLGTGLGIVPKIVVVAVLGAMAPGEAAMSDGVEGVLDFFTSRNPRDVAMAGAVIGLWLCFLFGVRIIYARMRKGEAG